MGFNYLRVADVPSGRIVPMYLSDEGDLYPIFLRSEEELEVIQDMVGMIMDHNIPIDTKHPINAPNERLKVINLKERKNK